MPVVPLLALMPPALGEVFFGDCWYEPVEQVSGKYFACDGE